jgi:hypothetical protein
MFALLVDTHHLMSLSAAAPGTCAIDPAAWRPGPAPIGHNPACDVCTNDPAGICVWSGAPATSYLVNDRGTNDVDEHPWFVSSNARFTTPTFNNEWGASAWSPLMVVPPDDPTAEVYQQKRSKAYSKGE